MADHGRQDLTDKVAHKATPDSSKSTLDKAGESVSGLGDKVARDVVPDSALTLIVFHSLLRADELFQVRSRPARAWATRQAAPRTMRRAIPSLTST